MAKSSVEYLAADDDRDLYSGLIRLHVLHHAVRQPIFGLGVVEEFQRHGYRISPGTLYPLLHGLENRGYLRSARKCKTANRVGKSTGQLRLDERLPSWPRKGCASCFMSWLIVVRGLAKTGK
jgi:PadR family transcriptional regulator PadR